MKGQKGWKYHIGPVTSKISKTICIRYYVPTSTLLTIYRSLVFPFLSYGILVWSQAAQTYINKVLALQKLALRHLCFAPYRSHAIPLLVSSNTIPVTMLYFKYISIITHDVFNKLTPCSIFVFLIVQMRYIITYDIFFSW